MGDMQDSCSCAHTNLLTNGLQCPSSVPYNATAEFCVSSDKRSLLPSRTNPEGGGNDPSEMRGADRILIEWEF
jgi:hypothetical protein